MASTYLTRNTGGSGTSGTIATLSLWVKLSDITNFIGVFSASSNSTGSPFCLISRENTGEFRFSDYTNNTTVRAEKITSALARDVNGWYHIVIAIDTNQATASDRIKFYINGVLQTSFSTNTNYSLGATTSLGQNNEMVIGRYEPYNAGYWNGLVSHFHYTDGTAYDASTFGETDATTGIWKPKTAPSVTYGTNGFFLKFENSGSMGTDSSPNGNNFTVNGTLTQTVDTPSNVFATLNPKSQSNSNVTFANGNLTHTTSGSWLGALTTLGAKNGKWYAEYKATDIENFAVGIVKLVNSNTSNYMSSSGNPSIVGYYNDGWGIMDNWGTVNFKHNGTDTAAGITFTNGDIVMIAMDLDNSKVWFGKNGTWFNSGNPANGTNAIYSNVTADEPIGFMSTCENSNGTWNFGNGYFGTTAVSSATSDESGLGIFEYTVPSGYYALCTKNINEQEYD